LHAPESRTTLPEDVTFPDFTTYIQIVNNALSPFNYEIRSTHPQTAPTRSPESAVYALVNATSDPATQLATTRSADEIAFVKRLLDAMFEAHNHVSREVMAIRVMDAVRLVRPSRESGVGGGGDGAESQANKILLTMAGAEKLIQSLVEEEWLDRSPAGFVTLSPRGLLELRGWLVDSYNDSDAAAGEWQRVKNCEGCKQIVTMVSFFFFVCLSVCLLEMDGMGWGLTFCFFLRGFLGPAMCEAVV
jgi:hypothetical protein